MKMHLHHLTGCAPVPLAHYLKALGVLRLVAEQADPAARGWWQDEHFCLLTKLDRDAVERFFLKDYSPTPFVSPWNRGSGFFAPVDKGLTPVERSTAPRFAPFRAGIVASRAELKLLDEAAARVRALKDSTKARKAMTQAEQRAAVARKSDPEFKRELAAAEKEYKARKSDVFKPYALAWRGPHRRWMDAALVLTEDGVPKFPSLLGTGGNDARLDFTNNAMQRLGELFDLESPSAEPRASAQSLLREALWQIPSNALTNDAIGQFLPGAAGGTNSTTGPDGPPLINPWDFIVMMEGTLLYSARVTRRLDAASSSRASAPFAVHAHAVGHGTVGGEKAERGEQWMPLWTNPATLGDVATLFGDARLQLGRQIATRPLDVALALSRIGVARGLSEFVRVGYLERYGQNNFAVPLGRVRVRPRITSRLVDDVAPWLERLQRHARDGNAPARLVRAEQVLANAVFDVLLHASDEPARWQAVLAALVMIEEVQLGGAATQAGPIPPLSYGWLSACDDGTATWRLAVALGSAAAGYDERGRASDPVRHHWLPLKPNARRYDEREKRLAKGPRVVMAGREPVNDCIAVVERRVLEATSRGSRRLPLVAAPGHAAELVDLRELLAGGVDLDRVVTLARALMAIRWCSDAAASTKSRAHDDWPDEAWMAIRLAHLSAPLDKERAVAVDSAILRRLESGDTATAVDLALRRLRAAGLRPPIAGATTTTETARLWAAALVFPVSQQAVRAMASRFARRTKEIR